MSESNAGGVGQWLVDLVMKPGTSLQLVPFINAVLSILVVLLVYLVVNGESSIHVYVMGFLAVGLMGSLNWFISEFRKVQQQQRESGGGGTGASDTGARQKAD